MVGSLVRRGLQLAAYLIPLAVLAVIIAGTRALALNPGDPVTIETGHDPYVTLDGTLQFDSGVGVTLPEGFFGEGSQTPTGPLGLIGNPLGGILGNTDIIVERQGDAAPIPIEVTALRLRSVEPLVVSFDDGSTQQWDVYLGLSSVPSYGTMDVIGDPTGGLFAIELEIVPELTFERVGTEEERVFDFALEEVTPRVVASATWAASCPEALQVDDAALGIMTTLEFCPGTDPASGETFPISLFDVEGMLALNVLRAPALDPTSLSLTGPASGVAGECNGPFVVTTVDAAGFPTPVAGDRVLNLADSTGNFFDGADPTCTGSIINEVVIDSDTAADEFFYLDTAAGDKILTVHDPASDLGPASAPFIVLAGEPAQLNVTGPASLQAGQCSGPFTTVTTDRFGNTASVAVDTAIMLTSSSGGAFWNNAGCTVPIDGVTIPEGAGAADFYYTNTMAGDFLIQARNEDHATSDGIFVGEVVAAVSFRLDVTGPATVPAGGCSEPFTVTTRDQFGNADPVVVDTPIALASATGGGFWTAADCTGPINEVVIPQDEISAGFYYSNDVPGEDTITAADTLEPGSTTVVVFDDIAPELSLPGDRTVEATGPGGARVEYLVTATDNADPDPSITCDPASGSTFPLGETTVSCVAEDASGNIAVGQFKVTVVDTTAPAVSCGAGYSVLVDSSGGATVPDLTTELPGEGAFVQASDAVTPRERLSITQSPAPGTRLGPGQHTITFTVTDEAGNSATCETAFLVSHVLVRFDSDSSRFAEGTGRSTVLVRVEFRDFTSTSLPEDVTVRVSDAGTGSATAGSDYRFRDGDITIPAGTPTGSPLVARLPIEIVDDSESEGAETVRLRLDVRSGPGVIGTPGVHTVNILDNDGDPDGDGVTDDKDRCFGTVIPEAVPSKKLGVNRYALVDGDDVFETTPPDGKEPDESFTVQETAGCSAEQIIERMGLGEGHAKFGISSGAIREWVHLVRHDCSMDDVPETMGCISFSLSTDAPGDVEQFRFTLSGGPEDMDLPFFLTELSGPFDTGPIEPGTYGLSASLPDGWHLPGGTCTGGSDPDPLDGVDVNPGEIVNCSLTGAKIGTITVDKVTIPAGDSRSFVFELNGGPAADPTAVDEQFDLGDADEPWSSGFLEPGSYVLYEALPPGWQSDRQIDCEGGSDVSRLDLASVLIRLKAGEHVRCTYTNTKLTTITLTKVVPGEDPQPFTFETRIGGIPAALVPGGITLNDDPSDAIPRSITFQAGPSETPLEVVEMLPSGWVVEDIVCTGPADGARVDITAGTALVDRDPGEEVHCTFVNVRRD